MALYETSADQLIERTCRLVLHDWLEGKATGGSTSTVVDTSRREVDDYFNEQKAHIKMRSGSAKGDWRLITDFVNSTWTITVAPNFTATTASGDIYAIFIEFEWDEIFEAINTAIDLVAQEALSYKLNESLEVQSDVYEYTLPPGFVYINKITEADGNEDFIHPIDPDFWDIVHDTSPKLHFKQFRDVEQLTDWEYTGLYAPTDGRKLRIEGLGRPERLVNEDSLCYINPFYVIAQAGAILHMSRTRRSDNDPDEHRVQYQLWQARADIERGKLIRLKLPANSKAVEVL